MTAAQLPPNPRGDVLESPLGQPVPPCEAGGGSEGRWRERYGSRRILGMRVDATTYAETTEAVVRMARVAAGGMVCVANVHMVMEAHDDPDFRRTVNAADRVTPDGMPLVAALRLLGIERARRVYGPTLTPIVCRRAAVEGLRVGFFGSTPEVLDALTRRLRERIPELDVGFTHAPPFHAPSDAEDAAVVEAIRDAGVQILFVGLGCPKQERWMGAHRDRLSCPMLGVGAAFDFLAGAKRQAPPWLQRLGLEWSFRLLDEPRRLWRRYLIGNPRFVHHFAGQLWRARRTGA